MTPSEIGLLGALIAVISGLGGYKLNGMSSLRKEVHEALCQARLKPITDDLVEIKQDVKELLRLSNGGM